MVFYENVDMVVVNDVTCTRQNVITCVVVQCTMFMTRNLSTE